MHLVRSVFAWLLAFFLILNLHEIGHTAVARLLGDPSAAYSLYRLRPGGGLACVGCNFYDPARLSPLANALVALGGLAFTQAAAATILFWTRQKKTALVSAIT